MSEVVNTTTPEDAIRGLLSSLVPPDEIVFTNIFGDEFVKPSNVSARKQIKILRIVDDLKEIELDGLTFDNMQSIVDSIMKLAADERVMKALCNCFSLAHPDALQKTIEKANEINCDYEQEFAAADLFSIEELVSSIIPLFIRIAKRAGQAIRALSNAA